MKRMIATQEILRRQREDAEAAEAARLEMLAEALKIHDAGRVEECILNHADRWEHAVRRCDSKATHVVRIGATVLPACTASAEELRQVGTPVMALDAAVYERSHPGRRNRPSVFPFPLLERASESEPWTFHSAYSSSLQAAHGWLRATGRNLPVEPLAESLERGDAVDATDASGHHYVIVGEHSPHFAAIVKDVVA